MANSAAKEYVDAVVNGAVLELTEKYPNAQSTDREYQWRIEAMAYTKAAIALSAEFKSVFDAIVYIAIAVERNQFWRVEERDSLVDWASVALDNLVQESDYEWDYVQRFISAIVRMFVPAEKYYPVDPTTGEILSAEDLWDRTPRRVAKALPYYFDNGSDEVRQEIAGLLAKGAKYPDYAHIIETGNNLAEERLNTSEAGELLSEEEQVVFGDKAPLYVKPTANGTFELSGALTEGQIRVLEGLVGGFFEVRFATN